MTIRWKTRSEADGNLVILTHEPFVLIDGDGTPIRGRPDPGAAISNGYRYAVRYPAPGSAFNGAMVRTTSGVYAVPDPGRDWGGGRGPELPPAGSVPQRRTGQTQQTSRQATAQPTPQGNPFLAAAASAAPLLDQGEEEGSDWIQNGLGKVRQLFGNRNPFQSGPNIPAGSNLAANLQFGGGGMTSASPGALGSVKGPPVGQFGTNAGAGSGTSGMAAGVNAVAPWVIAAIVAKHMISRSTAPSQKEAFPSLFEQGRGLQSAPPAGGFAMPGNVFHAKQPEIRSFASVARNAGFQNKSSGKLPEYASGKPPATAKSGSMYTTGGKPFVLLTKDDPIVKQLANTGNPVRLNPAGRLGVNPNQYGRMAAAAYTTTEKYLGNERGGK